MDQRLGGNPNAPTVLATPARNRYFYGKLLDVPHFWLEQSYFNSKRWLLNRLLTGTGIVCGLAVTPTPDGTGVMLSPGVAIDEWGREILVSDTYTIDPFTLTDWLGNALGTVSGMATVTICLLYHECGVEPTPVLVSSCSSNDGCEPGTIAERYRVVVQQGEIAGSSLNCIFPGIFGSQTVPYYGSSTFQSDLVQQVTQNCTEPSGSPCVPIAQVSLPSTGGITRAMIDQSGCSIVANNQLLLQLIVCLAQRIEECCGPAGTPMPTPTPTPVAGTPTPTPNPTPPPTPTPTPPPPTPTPTPTPPPPTPTPVPVVTFQVTGVQFLNKAKVVEAAVKSPRITTSVPAGITTIRVSFNQPISMLSVSVANSNASAPGASFLVQRASPLGVVPGTVKLAAPNTPNTVDFTSFEAFTAGEYQVTLFGTLDPIHRRPAITSTTNALLDGEPNAAFPSGNGTPGGNFVFRFVA